MHTDIVVRLLSPLELLSSAGQTKESICDRFQCKDKKERGDRYGTTRGGTGKNDEDDDA
jgi:hypothetical protein